MFKVLLVVYVLGGGHDYTYNQGFTFQEFNTMDDCEQVEKDMKELANAWYRKSKDNPITLNYSTKCVPMKSVKQTVYQPDNIVADTEESEPPEEPRKYRTHERWDR